MEPLAQAAMRLARIPFRFETPHRHQEPCPVDRQGGLPLTLVEARFFERAVGLAHEFLQEAAVAI